MAVLAERVGDPALAAAIEALRANEIQVDEAPYVQVDNRIYLLVVLGRVWEWVVELAKWIGGGSYRFFIMPFCSQDRVVGPLRNRGVAPVGFSAVEGRSGIHALMQLAVHVESVRRVIDGYGTLGAALERVPAFGAEVAHRREVFGLEALVAVEGGGGAAQAVDPVQVALNERRSLEESLEIPLIRHVLQDEALRGAVIEYLRRVKELDLFFAEYAHAQGEGAHVMTPALERFFELCAFERLENSDVTEQFSHFIPPVRLPLHVAIHVQESRSFVHTGTIDTPRRVPRLQRSDSVAALGNQIKDAIKPPQGPSVQPPRKREKLIPADQGVERRRAHVALHMPMDTAPSLDTLLHRFSRVNSPFDLAYVRHQIEGRAESKDGEIRRVITHAPQQMCFTLDRIQWRNRGIHLPPERVVNEREMDLPIDGMRLPRDVLLTGVSPEYNLTAFIAFDSKTGKYAFYKWVARDDWVEVIDDKMRGVLRDEAHAIARRHAVIVHYTDLRDLRI